MRLAEKARGSRSHGLCPASGSKRFGVGRAVLAVAVAVAVAACNEEQADPGNRRLSALESDPAVGLVVPGAKLTHKSSSAAQLSHVDKDESFYAGPHVSRHYRLSGDAQEAIGFYKARLPKLGWILDKDDPAQGLYVYTKEIDDWEATLALDLQGEGGSELALTLDAPPKVERSG